MQIIDVVGQMYMQANTSFDLPRYLMQSNYVYSMTFTNKGIEIAYERIRVCKKLTNRKNCFKPIEPMQKFRFSFSSIRFYYIKNQKFRFGFR